MFTMRGRPLALVSAAAVVLAAAVLRADSWPLPQPYAVFASTGEYFVRILPKLPTAGRPAGGGATALVYRLQPNRSYALVADVALVHPQSPVNVLVARSGSFITFDNWHEAGYGTVVGIYSADGRLVRGFTLEQLYDEKRLVKIPTSVSSRHWRCTPYHFVEPDEQKTVYVPEALGGYFVFDLATGAVVHHEGKRRECQAPPLPRP
jgi:hypothetical protein